MGSSPASTPFTGDLEADRLVSENPLALLVGMLLDQQVPIERAFHAPLELRDRLGGTLDARAISDMDPDELEQAFRRRPALHRFPAAMAARTRELCRIVAEDHDGDAAQIWRHGRQAGDVLADLSALPGFGERKARVLVALLAKRIGVRPSGWERAAGEYARPGYHSVADVDGPEALARLREHKRQLKAAAKSSRP